MNQNRPSHNTRYLFFKFHRYKSKRSTQRRSNYFSTFTNLCLVSTSLYNLVNLCSGQYVCGQHSAVHLRRTLHYNMAGLVYITVSSSLSFFPSFFIRYFLPSFLPFSVIHSFFRAFIHSFIHSFIQLLFLSLIKHTFSYIF